MTEIEALKILKPFIDEKCMEYKNEIYFGYEENFEALQMAINALEKQIPKKPKEKDCIGFNILACPECKMSLYSYEQYCDNCGQAIDWSDEE